jgi:hypothetical protein
MKNGSVWKAPNFRCAKTSAGRCTRLREFTATADIGAGARRARGWLSRAPRRTSWLRLGPLPTTPDAHRDHRLVRGELKNPPARRRGKPRLRSPVSTPRSATASAWRQSNGWWSGSVSKLTFSVSQMLLPNLSFTTSARRAGSATRTRIRHRARCGQTAMSGRVMVSSSTGW